MKKKNKSGMLDQMPKFFEVGIISTLVDWSIYAVLIYLNAYPVGAVAISFTIGAIINFTLNQAYTFKSTDHKIYRMLSFGIIVLSAWYFTLLLVEFLNNIIHIDYFPKLVSIGIRICVTCIIFVYNYFMHKYITFRRW